jgi:hypothetical protein
LISVSRHYEFRNQLRLFQSNKNDAEVSSLLWLGELNCSTNIIRGAVVFDLSEVFHRIDVCVSAL